MYTKTGMNIDEDHCMKSVQIQNLFWPVYSRIRTEYGEILSIWTLFTQWIML